MGRTQLQRNRRVRVLAGLLAVCVALSGFWLPNREISGATSSAMQKAKEKKAKLEQQLKNARQELEEQKKVLANASSEQEKLAAQLAVEEKEKEALTAQLLTLYADSEAIVAALEDAEAAYNEAEANFYERSRIMYIYSTQSPLEILAGSESVADFFKRIQLILYLADEDNRLLEELEIAKTDYAYKKQYQEECQEIINEMIAQRDLAIDNITLTKEELQAKIAKAQALLGEVEKQEAAIEEDLDAVKSELKKLEEAEKAANASKPGSNGSSGGNTYTGGVMLWPVPASTRITSPYGTRKDPITGVTATHTGIDIGAAKGSSILAAADGTVIMATTNGGFGLCIKIDHGGGIVSLYGHCNELLVKTGQQVKKGDLIARVGTTGRSTGYHLHFEVRKNGKHTDPMPYLQG